MVYTQFQNEVSNPFCAARLRPGTIDFVFAPGETIDALVDALAANGWRGQIIGGHGTGKSTLLAALRRAIEQRGRWVEAITLTTEDRRMPRDFFNFALRANGPGLAMIDGFEQLNMWRRLRIKRFCRARKLGLVVASHRSAGIASLYSTIVDNERASEILDRLQYGFPRGVVSVDLVARLARREGNLREAFFDLYDLYEERAALKPASQEFAFFPRLPQIVT